MKLSSIQQPIKTSKKLTKTSFSIAHSPHAFSILSSGLYSNKIAAVIRELSCNAVDAHIYVKKDKQPFEVHLPNILEPYFSIRDYGPGLSDEEVISLYTTYFSSGHGKIESNDVTGCFGLGSKSFFAYTDTANLTSFYNGKATNYVLIIENGFPKVIKLSDGISTEEPSGLLVKFAVSKDDILKFCNSARKIYTYFKLRPTISGQELSNLDTKYIYKNDIFGLRESDNNNARIIMGNIAYPVILPDVEEQPNIDIFVQIGECDITPSRENLSFTKKTNQCIIKYVKQIREITTEYIANLFSNIPNLFEAKKIASSLNKYQYTTNSILYSLSDKKSLTYNKNSVETCITLPKLTYTTNIIYYEAWRKSRYKLIKPSMFHVRSNLTYYFYEDDLKVGGQSRCINFVKNNSDAYMILCRFSDQKEKILFCETLGIPESYILKTSTLSKPPNKTRSSSYLNLVGQNCIWQFTSNGLYKRDLWSNANLTELLKTKTPQYYVILKSYDIYHNNLKKDKHYLLNKIQYINSLSNTDHKIYGISTRILKTVQKAGWINFFDYYDQNISSLINKNELLYVYILKQSLKNNIYFNTLQNIFNYLSWKELNPNNNIYKICKIIQMLQNNSNIDHYRLLSDCNNIKLNDTLKRVDKFMDLNYILDSYPMLKTIQYYNLDEYSSECLEYIKLIDSVKNPK